MVSQIQMSLIQTNVRNHIACSFGYKLVYVDDMFNNPFKSYIGEDATYNYIDSMIKESKYCSQVMKKHFKKDLVMTKKDKKDFKNSTKCQICDNTYVDGDVEGRDHCHVIGKYRGFAHRDCNFNGKLTHKIPILFDNLKKFDSHLIMQEPGKLNHKINVIPNGLENI